MYRLLCTVIRVSLCRFLLVLFLFFLFFAEMTHRFQTAREDVRALLIQCLLPWLHNMELVATSVPPATPLSYIMVSAITQRKHTYTPYVNK